MPKHDPADSGNLHGTYAPRQGVIESGHEVVPDSEIGSSR